LTIIDIKNMIINICFGVVAVIKSFSIGKKLLVI